MSDFVQCKKQQKSSHNIVQKEPIFLRPPLDSEDTAMSLVLRMSPQELSRTLYDLAKADLPFLLYLVFEPVFRIRIEHPLYLRQVRRRVLAAAATALLVRTERPVAAAELCLVAIARHVAAS